jgi:hypothetical protein
MFGRTWSDVCGEAWVFAVGNSDSPSYERISEGANCTDINGNEEEK